MKTYLIPIIYQRVETISVDAESLQEAADKALSEFYSVPDDCYVCDSAEVDSIVFDEYPNEPLNQL